jgi:hypothetical protein
MPQVPDASSVTTYARVRATLNVDPEKKSRTFVPAMEGGYLNSIVRASETQRYAQGNVLSIPAWKTPQFNGRFFLM